MAHTCVTNSALRSQRLLSKKQKIIQYYHKENQVSQLNLVISSRMIFNIHGREISNGHFSEDNQKRLNRPSPTDVPVFEAKLSRDLRLVVSLSYYDVSHQLLTFPY